MQPPLFPGRDVHAGTDPAFDSMLREALGSERMPEQVPPDERIIRRVQRKAPPEKTPLPPLLKVYWVLIALLLLLLLAALCNRRQETSSTAPATVQLEPASTPSVNSSPTRPVFLPQSGPAVPRAQLVRCRPLAVPD
jgi:hypothetical protein